MLFYFLGVALLYPLMRGVSLMTISCRGRKPQGTQMLRQCDKSQILGHTRVTSTKVLISMQIDHFVPNH